MYRVTKGIHLDFAHNVYGHSGPCLSIHGHTWRFDVVLEAGTLSNEGFVVDFKKLKEKVLEPCLQLLDHGYAIDRDTFFKKDADGRQPFLEAIETISVAMMESRMSVHGTCEGKGRWLFKTHRTHVEKGRENLCGAYDCDINGQKVVVFPFAPTSEKLAKWLFSVAQACLEDDRVKVVCARVSETLHPVESMAEYRPTCETNESA